MSGLANLNSQIAAAQRVRPIIRSAVAALSAKANQNFEVEEFERLYGRDTDAQTRSAFKLLTRTASTPHTMANTSALVPNLSTDLINFMAPYYAGPKILSSALPAKPQTVVHPLFTPAATDNTWLTEGGGIPVYQGTLGAGVVMDENRFGCIVVFTAEIAKYSIPSFEYVVREGLSISAGATIDAALFSGDSGTAVVSAGLLEGISPTTASAADDLEQAMLNDVAAVTGAVSGVSQNARLVLVASPTRANKLRMFGERIERVADIYGSPAVGENALICVAPNTVAAAIDPAPRFEASAQATLHMSDTPSPLSATGTPNTVAAGIRSLLQTDTLALRVVMSCSWLRRSTSGVAHIASGMDW